MITITQEQLYFWINQFFWPLVRILAFLAVDPIFSIKTIPRRVSIGLAVALTLVVVPSLETVQIASPSGPQGFMLLLQQIVIGVSIGFVARLTFTAIEFAGNLSGTQMGLAFAAQLDPVHGSQTPVVAQLFSIMATLVFLAMNGHLMMLSVIIQSFHLFPIYPAPVSASAFSALVYFGERVFSLGILLSLPVVATLLMTNLVIGMIARASPQMNLFAVGFPITLVIGFAALYFSLPSMPSLLGSMFDQMVKFQFELLKALRPSG
ncbi:flagellar biosynthetic protein FliR [Leeia sp. TBRC 13508]|uniref:Flagellar biosynthetic protein FliR n=1 Tax=Leeia speluncae TaxID=2884804 RepID=A0ABS8D5V5_9NEIS|nr:flagellar biosynthetic protein FliR [Leeia speluncae]MCB6183575.1 flagellar biosynthetic protein FliR [Leeia speluncae]